MVVAPRRVPTPKLKSLLSDARKRVRMKDLGDWGDKERLVVEACHPKQRGLVEDDSLYIAALTGRGCGKTTAIRARLVRRMIRTAKARCLYIATTRDQAIELLWLPLKELVEKLGIDAKWDETRLKVTFRKNGSSLRLVGADDMRQIEKYRGQPFHEVWIDESASYPVKLLEHLLDRIIGPRLGDFGGTLGMVGTPGHVLRGQFYDATRPGSPLHRKYDDRALPEYVDGSVAWKWSFHAWTLQDGAPHVPALERLWARALLDKHKNGWTDDNPVWRREYLGQWAADDTERVFKYRAHLDDGTPWNQWDPPRIGEGALRFAKLPAERTDWLYVFGMDLGSRDPFALEVFAFSPTDPSKTLYHVFEFVRTGMYPRTIAELLLGEELSADHPRGVIGHTGWPSGAVADRDGSGDALLMELAQVYGINIEGADKKNYHDSVELTNGDLIDGRMKVLKGSVLEEQMCDMQWAVDDFGKLKKNKGQRDDAADATIYARRKAHHLLAVEAPAAPAAWKPPALPGQPDPESRSSGEFGDLLFDQTYDDDDWN